MATSYNVTSQKLLERRSSLYSFVKITVRGFMPSKHFPFQLSDSEVPFVFAFFNTLIPDCHSFRSKRISVTAFF